MTVLSVAVLLTCAASYAGCTEVSVQRPQLSNGALGVSNVVRIGRAAWWL